ncbi:MAG: SCO family protein [Chloroflexota bacterium]|nr:SCO family protein [Chloroflexota bacterium]
MIRSRVASIAIIVIALVACAPIAPRLSGTELGPALAHDFTLTDGVTGDAVTLSSLRGNVVALAFLYTHCPDVCPLTAAQLRAAQGQLGQDAVRVRFVAVSVDPEGDTPSAVKAFSLAHDLRDNWRYLIGPRAALQSVWTAYGVGAFAAPTGSGVDHNDAIYLIDAGGREREIVHSDIALKDLVADIRAVLAASR